MDSQTRKSLQDIITEAKSVGVAGITEIDLVTLKKVVDAGYGNDELVHIATSSEIKRKVLSEKIADINFDKHSVLLLEQALLNNLGISNAAVSVGNSEQNVKTTHVCFKTERVDGVVLLQNNAVAVYRSGIQQPATILCKTADDALKVYKEIVEEM